MLHNRRVVFGEWIEANSGLWWWRASSPDALVRALAQPVTVVPAGAPLLGRVSPLDNSRAYAALFGRTPTAQELVTCLRTVEIPDHAVRRSAEKLTELHRLLVWLAMARLAATPVVIFIEPLERASTAHRDHFRRLILEAEPFHRHVFVVAPHSETAVVLGAKPVPGDAVMEP